MAGSVKVTQGGAGGRLGWDYQDNVSILCYHRGYNQEYEFTIRTEKTENGKFDDIEYAFSKNGTDGRILFQIKYKEQEENKISYNLLMFGKEKGPRYKINKQFYLKPYFKSYKNMNISDKDKLCIYTNIDFDVDLTSSFEQVNENEMVIKELFSCNDWKSKKCLKFCTLKYSEKIQNDLKISPADCKQFQKFLGKLIFAVNQPNIKEIEEIVKKELAEKYNLTSSSDIFEKMHAEFHDFLSDTKGNKSHKNAKDFFDEVEKNLKANNLLGMHELPLKKWLANGDFYNNVCSLNDSDILNTTEKLIHVTSKSTSLSFIKVVQFFKNNMNEKDFNFGFAAIDLNSFLILVTQSKFSFKIFYSYWLVVKCSQLNEEEMNLAMTPLKKLINDFYKSGLKRKLILISIENDTLCQAALKGKSYECIDDTCQFNHFSSFVQQQILGKLVMFQEQEVLISQLVGDIVDHLPEDNLENLLSDNISINGKSWEVVDSCYIERNLMKCQKLEKSIFTNVGEDVLVFSNIEKKEILSMCDESKIYQFDKIRHLGKQSCVIIMPDKDDEKAFNRIQQQFSGKNIYWFHKEGERLLQIFPLANENCAFPDGVKIIEGEPGIGKSWVMNKIMHSVKSKDPKLWCMLIKINDHFKHLENLCFIENEDENLKSAIEFLIFCEISDKTKVFEKTVLRNLIKRGQVALFFDGFDESSPSCREKLLQLIKCLNSKKIHHVWISSRLHYQSELEEHAECSFRLSLFSKTDQINFLMDFWKNNFQERCPSIDESHIKNFAQKLIDVFVKSTFNRTNKFIEIPLQAKLLAEIYEDKCKNYINMQTLEKRIDDLDQLYKMFVEKKIEIYSKEKRDEKIGTSAKADDFRREKLSWLNLHEMLAFKVLFPEQEKSFAIGNMEPEDKMTLLRIGIVQKTNGDLRFMHRTFAEYFLAHFIVKIINNRDTPMKQSAIAFLKNEFLNVSNELIRFFIDNMLAKSSDNLDIHAAIFKGNSDVVKKLLNANPEKVFSKDPLGRLPLHLAASYGNRNTIEIVIKMALEYEKGLSFLISCDELDYQPISYAFAQSFPDCCYTVINLIKSGNTLDKFFTYFASNFKIIHQRGSNIKDWTCAFKSHSQHECKWLIESLNYEDILVQFDYDTEKLQFLLGFFSLRNKVEMLEASNCILIKKALGNYSLKALQWVGEVNNEYRKKRYSTIENLREIDKMVEFQDCLKRAAIDNDIPMLRSLTEIMDPIKVKVFWQENYKKIFKSATEHNQCDMAKLIFCIIKEEVKINENELVKIALRHRHYCVLTIHLFHWIKDLKRSDEKYNEICNLAEVEECFMNAWEDKKFEMLKEINNCLSIKRAKNLWDLFSYADIFSSTENKQCDLANSLLCIFKDDLKINEYKIVKLALRHRHYCVLTIHLFHWIKDLKRSDEKSNEICNLNEFEECFKNASEDKDFEMLNEINNCLSVKRAKMLWHMVNYAEVVTTLLEGPKLHCCFLEILQFFKEILSDDAKQFLEQSLEKSFVNAANKNWFKKLYALSKLAMGRAKYFWQKVEYQNIFEGALKSNAADLVEEILDVFIHEMQTNDFQLIKMTLKEEYRLTCQSFMLSEWLYKNNLSIKFIEVCNLDEFEPYFCYSVERLYDLKLILLFEKVVAVDVLKTFLKKANYISVLSYVLPYQCLCESDSVSKNEYIDEIRCANLFKTIFKDDGFALLEPHLKSISLQVLKWIGKQKELKKIKDAICDAIELEECFIRSSKENNYEMMKEICEFVGVQKANTFWKKLNVIDVFKAVSSGNDKRRLQAAFRLSLPKQEYFTKEVIEIVLRHELEDKLLDVFKQELISGDFQIIIKILEYACSSGLFAKCLPKWLKCNLPLLITKSICTLMEFKEYFNYLAEKCELKQINFWHELLDTDQKKELWKDVSYISIFFFALECIDFSKQCFFRDDRIFGKHFFKDCGDFLTDDGRAIVNHTVKNISVEVLNTIRRSHLYLTKVNSCNMSQPSINLIQLIKEEICNSETLDNYFNKSVADGHFRLLFEITEFIGAEKAAVLWRKHDYVGIFKRALEVDTDLAKTLLRVFQDENILAKIDCLKEFRVALERGRFAVLQILVEYSNDDQKQNMWSQFFNTESINIMQKYIKCYSHDRNDFSSKVLSEVLKFTSLEECKKVCNFLKQEYDIKQEKLWYPPCVSTMRNILEEWLNFQSDRYEWSIPGHLFYLYRKYIHSEDPNILMHQT